MAWQNISKINGTNYSISMHKHTTATKQQQLVHSIWSFYDRINMHTYGWMLCKYLHKHRQIIEWTKVGKSYAKVCGNSLSRDIYCLHMFSIRMHVCCMRNVYNSSKKWLHAVGSDSSSLRVEFKAWHQFTDGIFLFFFLAFLLFLLKHLL